MPSEDPSSSAEHLHIEQLIAHADWIHRLATRLVGDPDRADDVVQETWLAAIRFPPTRSQSVRGWLSKVVRSRAYRQSEDERRRSIREHATEEARRTPSPGDVIEKVQLQRLVVDCVMEIAEPTRSTLLLHFLEELSVREISDRQEVPEPTVRTRIRRGLIEVRGRLDSRHDGDRDRWMNALLPLVGAGKVGSKTVASFGSLGWIVGAGLLGAVALGFGLDWFGSPTVQTPPAHNTASVPEPHTPPVVDPSPKLAVRTEAANSPSDSSTLNDEDAVPDELPALRTLGVDEIRDLFQETVQLRVNIYWTKADPWGSITYPTSAPLIIDDPGVIGSIRSAASESLAPMGMSMALDWPNQIEFVLADGRVIETCAAEKTFFVGHLSDSALTDSLQRLVAPLIADATRRCAIASGVVTGQDDIAGMPASTTEIIGYGLTDEDLRSLIRLKELRKANLRWCASTLSDQGIRHLADLPALDTLVLGWNSTLTGTAFSSLRNLRSLDLNYASALTTDGFRSIAMAPSLAELTLSNSSSVDNAAIGAIADSRSIEVMKLRRCRSVTADGFARLGSLSSLRDLRLDSNLAIDGRSLAPLAALPQLEALGLSRCDFDSAADILALRDLKTLRTLDLSGNRDLPGAALAAISSLPLQDLNLSSNSTLGIDAVSALSKLTSLHRLDVSGARLPDEAVASIAACQDLETLDIAFTEIEDDTLGLLLGAARNLKEIKIYGCKKLTDHALKRLAEAESIRVVNLDERQFSDETLQELRAARPDLTIE